jgi:hypothetical protein
MKELQTALEKVELRFIVKGTVPSQAIYFHVLQTLMLDAERDAPGRMRLSSKLFAMASASCPICEPFTAQAS